MTEPAYYKDLHALVNQVYNIQTDHVAKDAARDGSNAAERAEAYLQAVRVYDRLKDCLALCEVLDPRDGPESDTTQSLRRCLESFVGGRYRLYPDSDPLCLGFKVAGMHGGMIWHWRAREWSLHT